MKKELEKLKKACEEMELITKIAKKYGYSKVGEMMLQKKIEDSIISKFHTANLHQLNMMKDSYRFQYYDKDVVNKFVNNTIIKVTRLEKLKKIKKLNEKIREY